MPYIKQNQRDYLERQPWPQTAGELNYMFTTLINKYGVENGVSYRTINDILGALEGAKLEFYRRIVAPYEDQKIKENGDVY